MLNLEKENKKEIVENLKLLAEESLLLAKKDIDKFLENKSGEVDSVVNYLIGEKNLES